MSAALRFKYARALEVLSSLEADQSSLQINHECELTEKDIFIAMLENNIGDAKGSIIRLEAALAAAGATNHEAGAQAQATADQLIAELREQLQASVVNTTQKEQHISQLEAEIVGLKRGFEEEHDSAFSCLNSELEALKGVLSSFKARTHKSEGDKKLAEAELQSLKDRNCATLQEATATEASLRAELEAALSRADEETNGRLAVERAYAACGEKLAHASGLLRVETAKTQGLEGALDEAKRRVHALADTLAEEESAHQAQAEALFERIASLEAELANLGGDNKFKKFVDLKNEKKNLERELSHFRHSAGGAGIGGSNTNSVLLATAGQRRKERRGSCEGKGDSVDAIERMIDRTSSALDKTAFFTREQRPNSKELTKSASQRRPVPRPSEPDIAETGVGVSRREAQPPPPALPTTSSFSFDIDGMDPPSLIPKPRLKGSARAGVSTGTGGLISNPPTSTSGGSANGESVGSHSRRNPQQGERGPRAFF